MKTLVCMPFVGDFGWHLMRYQAACRKKSREYGRTYVFCEKQYADLYKDFALQVVNMNVKGGVRDCWSREGAILSHAGSGYFCRTGPMTPIGSLSDAMEIADKILIPEDICASPTTQQEFIDFAPKIPGQNYPYLIIHARNTSKKDYGGDRNWPMEKYVELLKQIDTNRTVISIGTDAHHIPGTMDKRNIPLRELMDLFHEDSICVGPSSGPHHLASLCRCPHLVWAGTGMWNLGSCKGTNRERYEQKWNPFGTPVKFLDPWQPTVEEVAEQFKEMI